MIASKKALAAGLGSALALAGIAQGAALAAPQSSDATGPDLAGVAETGTAQGTVAHTDIVRKAAVTGTFSFTQDEVATNAYLQKHIAGSEKYVCAATLGGTSETGVSAEDWQFSVGGDVQNGYSATFGEIAQTSEVQSVLMGCTCAGNPADGLSTANALVKGISALILVDMADPVEDANTVVFTSADGYEVALPLSYLSTHYCPIVFDVNGSSLAASVGGTNQLWLGSTPASYFARDIVSITVEQRDTPPADPTSDEARETLANLPNVGVLFGGDVA